MTEVKGFESGEHAFVRVFQVTPIGERVWPVPHVWYDANSGARCCHCQGILVAMLSTCAHAQAVKRFIKKERRKK